MTKGGERLLVADGAMPPGIPVVTLSPEAEEMRRAIENHELYWRKCEPNNSLRFQEGIPIVTREELQLKKAALQKPFLKKKP